jgi:hypothetical protein
MANKGLEFLVFNTSFPTFAKAVENAVIRAASNGGTVNVDVLAHSAKAAKSFMGEDGEESYKEDPEASVFRRIAIKAEDLGRVA